uniref:Transmembrane protein n=1 Tax=Steinernema glaseri TaxID=37863 RepID=A0A1I7YPJ8_9BILA
MQQRCNRAAISRDDFAISGHFGTQGAEPDAHSWRRWSEEAEAIGEVVVRCFRRDFKRYLQKRLRRNTATVCVCLPAAMSFPWNKKHGAIGSAEAVSHRPNDITVNRSSAWLAFVDMCYVSLAVIGCLFFGFRGFLIRAFSHLRLGSLPHCLVQFHGPAMKLPLFLRRTLPVPCEFLFDRSPRWG